MWFLSAEGGKGDRITLDGEEFIVCDPTYINAGVGMAMLGLNTSSLGAMVLR